MNKYLEYNIFDHKVGVDNPNLGSCNCSNKNSKFYFNPQHVTCNTGFPYGVVCFFSSIFMQESITYYFKFHYKYYVKLGNRFLE